MLSEGLEKAKILLESGNHTLVIYEDDKYTNYNERGIKPLLSIYASGKRLFCAFAADKVIGRAAAYLYVLLEAKEIFCFVLSEGAKEVFERFKISVFYNDLVSNIINRSKTDICPIEKAVIDISDPHEAYSTIKRTLLTL